MHIQWHSVQSGGGYRQQCAPTVHAWRAFLYLQRCLSEWMRRQKLSPCHEHQLIAGISAMLPGVETSWVAELSRFDAKIGETCFVILARPVWSGISFIHDRMSVILSRERHDEWLNGHVPSDTMERVINAASYKTV